MILVTQPTIYLLIFNTAIYLFMTHSSSLNLSSDQSCPGMILKPPLSMTYKTLNPNFVSILKLKIFILLYNNYFKF